MNPEASIQRWLTPIAGGVAALGALAVLVTAWLGDAYLFRLHPDSSPMPVASAWSILSIAGGLVVLHAGLRRTAVAVASVSVLLGVGLLLVHAFGEAPATAANSAAAFLLMGLIVVAAGLRPGWVWLGPLLWSAALLAVVFGLAWLASFHLLADLRAEAPLFTELTYTGMLLFMLAGLAFLGLARRYGNFLSGDPYHWGATVAFFVMIALTTSVWQALVANEWRALETSARQVNAHTIQSLERAFEDKTQLAGRIRDFVQREGHLLSDEEWRVRGRTLLQDFPEISGLASIGPDRVFVSAYTRFDATGLVGARADPDPLRRAALDRVDASGRMQFTPGLDYLVGGYGFIAYVPVSFDDGASGYLLVGISTEPFIERALRDLTPGYRVRVYEHGEPVFGPVSSDDARVVVARDIRVPGSTWRVEVWPGEDIIARDISALPLIVFLLGVSGSVLVFLSLRLAGLARASAREAEHAERTQRAALESLSDSEERLRIAVLQSDRVVYDIDLGTGGSIWIGAVENLLGESRATLSELDRDAWFERIHPDDQPRVRAIEQALTGGRGSFVKEYRWRRGDGTWVWLEDAGILDDGRLIAVLTDVTPRHEAEAELEARVAQRTAELKQVNAELEAFNYSVSHDLRTPLRAIAGFTDALAEQYGDRLDEEGRHYLERVLRSTERMGWMIDDLLALARVSRSEFQRQRVDLVPIARRIMSHLEASEPDRVVHWTCPESLEVEGDPGLLEVVLQNLLGNAFKFSSARAEAAIELGRDGDAVFVRDNGVGFDMRYANKLYGLFQRLHRAEEYPGTGIGLATVHRAIERHGGEIWCEAEVGGGACFWFTLE